MHASGEFLRKEFKEEEWGKKQPVPLIASVLQLYHAAHKQLRRNSRDSLAMTEGKHLENPSERRVVSSYRDHPR
jgi:hypothetical protein